MNEQRSELRRHYLIYRITNLDNGMVYVGQHRTANPNDSYMGSGSLINKEYNRYELEGKKVKDHFRKEILFDFATFKEMNDKEREIVNEDFVADPRTYNRILGGNSSGQYDNGCLVIEHEGQKHTLAEWEAILGIDREIIRQRYKKGMTMQQIIDIPPRERDKIWFMLDGEGHTIYEWVKISGLDYSTLRRRLVELKMSFEEAVDMPMLRHRNQLFEFNGESHTINEWAKIKGIPHMIIHQRMRNNGMTFEQAITTPYYKGKGVFRKIKANSKHAAQ